MEKNRLIAAFLLFALAGCARVETDPVPGTVPGEQLLTVRIGGATTRTAFDNEAGDFTWTDGDQIALHCSASASGSVAASYKTPTLRVDASDPTVGQISVILSDGQTRNGYAVYPAASAVAAQWGSPTLQVTYPAEYQVDPAGMGDVSPTPMIAVNDPSATIPAGEPDLTFHHVGGLLRLTLNYVAGETKFITVNMGRQITGTFTVANPDTETPSVTGGDTADEVTFALTGDLAPGYDNTLVLNVPVPAGTYKSLTITALDADRQPLHSYYDEKERHFFPGRGRKQAATLSSLATPLCLEATELAYVTISNPKGLTMEISPDAVNWTTINAPVTEMWLSEGEKLYFRGDNENYGDYYSTSATNIRCSGVCYLYGNIMSLLQKENFDTLTSLGYSYSTFSNLFAGADIASHPGMQLLLPATSLAYACYQRMFQDCIQLKRAPELPATTLADQCYQEMFSGCVNLTDAPTLPATELAYSSYQSMFTGCTSLKDAPVLPATELSSHCYDSMFFGCTSLTQAPALPATELKTSCYSRMFGRCTSLQNAPVLPASVLANSCYESMFMYCSALQNPPELPATELATSCYEAMFRNSGIVNAPVLPASEMKQSCYNMMFYECSQLLHAPELPSTSLATSCYSNMFYYCTSMISGPELPATTLAQSCYNGMFYGCQSMTQGPSILPAMVLLPYCYSMMFQDCRSLEIAPILPAHELVESCYFQLFASAYSLRYVKAMFLTPPNDAFTWNWLSGGGTFVMNAAAEWDPELYRTGSSGIPYGWTIIKETE